MTLQVRSFAAGSSFCKANKKLQNKLNNYRKDRSERNPFKKEGKKEALLRPRTSEIPGTIIFTSATVRKLERACGRKVEDMDFADSEPFALEMGGKTYGFSLGEWVGIIRAKMHSLLGVKREADDASIKHMLCLIRNGMGREEAAGLALTDR
ncbi:MAG: hypothetical protein M1530_00175 [Candidatus Marsarchaeota archaeon]|nr:hypothetical protein [Candidatus Marsarchaeota archaeon]